MHTVPHKCGQLYSGQTKHSIETRVKEHQHHNHLEHPDKSAMAKSINLGHYIELQNTTNLSKFKYMDWIIREVNETQQHPNNMNRMASA
jgi:hypothetical protein